jgi:hypothetical protein
MTITANYDPFTFTDATFGEESDEKLAEVIDIATTPAPPIRCIRCGRKLTGKSAALGIGPVCARKAKAALGTLADYTDIQLEKAEELIELGAVIRLNAVEFEVIGSKGDHYVTDGARCECPAGENGRRCYHLAAVYAVAA